MMLTDFRLPVHNNFLLLNDRQRNVWLHLELLYEINEFQKVQLFRILGYYLAEHFGN